MINFNIINFLNKNTFLNKNISDSENVSLIQKESDDYFGDNAIRTYYFYFKGYTINFICDLELKKCKSEQIEVNMSIKSDNIDLNKIILYKDFIEIYDDKIQEIYADDDENVVFLKSGVNLYFTNYKDKKHLQKIISLDIPSRELVKSMMDRIK